MTRRSLALAQRHLLLRPAALAPFDHLYDLTVGTAAGDAWVTQGETVSRARFAELLDGPASWSFVHVPTGETVGHGALRSLDPAAGTAWLSTVVDPRLGSAALLEGAARLLLAAWGFDHLGLRKLRLEAAATEARTLAAETHWLPWSCTAEGVWRAHRRLRADLVDVHHFALWREPPPAAGSQVRSTSAEAPWQRVARALLPERGGPVACPPEGARLAEDLGLDPWGTLALADAVDERRASLGRPPLVLEDLDTPLTLGLLRDQQAGR